METKKDKIKINATILFATKGIKNTSMRDLAASLNSAVGGLYYHYPSKEKLLEEILEESIENRKKFLESIEYRDISLEEKLKLLLRRRLDLQKDRYSLYLFAKIFENGEANLTCEEFQKGDKLFENFLKNHKDELKERYQNSIEKIGKVLSAAFTKWLLLLIENTEVEVYDMDSYNEMVEIFNRTVNIEEEIETFYSFSIEPLLEK